MNTYFTIKRADGRYMKIRQNGKTRNWVKNLKGASVGTEAQMQACLDKIQRENIMVAGPTTIIALLNTLSMGFKAVAINEKANEVRQLLAVTKAQYEKFGAVLDKARKKIDEAGKTLSEAQDRNRIIQKRLRNVEEIDSASADEYLGIEGGESITDFI